MSLFKKLNLYQGFLVVVAILLLLIMVNGLLYPSACLLR